MHDPKRQFADHRTNRRTRQPGRGMFLRIVQRHLPDAAGAAQYVANTQHPYESDVPAELAPQLDMLRAGRYVKIESHGYILRWYGPSNMREPIQVVR